MLMTMLTFIGTSRMGVLNDKVNGIANVRMPQMNMLYEIMKDYDVDCPICTEYCPHYR